MFGRDEESAGAGSALENRHSPGRSTPAGSAVAPPAGPRSLIFECSFPRGAIRSPADRSLQSSSLAGASRHNPLSERARRLAVAGSARLGRLGAFDTRGRPRLRGPVRAQGPARYSMTSPVGPSRHSLWSALGAHTRLAVEWVRAVQKARGRIQRPRRTVGCGPTRPGATGNDRADNSTGSLPAGAGSPADCSRAGGPRTWAEERRRPPAATLRAPARARSSGRACVGHAPPRRGLVGDCDDGALAALCDSGARATGARHSRLYAG
jgi:hypothetical protein